MGFGWGRLDAELEGGGRKREKEKRLVMIWAVCLVVLCSHITAVPLGQFSFQPAEPILLAREDLRHSVSVPGVCNLEDDLADDLYDHDQHQGIEVEVHLPSCLDFRHVCSPSSTRDALPFRATKWVRLGIPTR